MQVERETDSSVRLFTDEVAALVFAGLLWLPALAGFSALRPAMAATCCLLLLTRLRPWLSISATVVAVFLLVRPGVTPAWVFALQAGAFLATVFSLRAAAIGPGLVGWQAAAAGATWLLLGCGSGQVLPGVALLALVLLRAAFSRAVQAERDEKRFATFIGASVAAGALWNGRGEPFSWLTWLLPVAPLVLDAAFSALRRLRHPSGSSVRVSALVAQAAGQWQTAGVVIFVLGFAWYGLAALWNHLAQYSIFYTAAMVSVPVVCMWLVVSVAAHSEPARVAGGRDVAGTTGRILGFDGLRAIAVALVVLSHAGLVEGGEWERSGAARVFNAQVGVQIFFVLSGLLITHLMLAEHARTGRVDLSRFYLRRVLRIFPVYYAAIALSFALSVAGIYRIYPQAFGAAIAYVMNFASWDYMEATFSHFWSLAVEEHFYFLWPVVVVLARGRALASGICAAAAILMMTLWLAYPPTFVLELAPSHAVGRWTIPAAMPILVGCLAACLMWRRTLPPAVASTLGIAGLFAFLLPVTPSALGFVPEWGRSLLSSAAIAAMIAFVVASPFSLAVRVLELRPLAYLGTISYGIYIWQGILTGNGPYRQRPGWPPEPLIGAALAVVVAVLSYHFFEEPILRYKDRLGRFVRPEA